jgi:hypothetical protein
MDKKLLKAIREAEKTGKPLRWDFGDYDPAADLKKVWAKLVGWFKRFTSGAE